MEHFAWKKEHWWDTKKFFHRDFKITAIQESIIYWSEEQKGWRRFMIGNLIEWKAIV